MHTHPTIEAPIDTAKTNRPRWNQTHNGMTWRDMPQQSHSDVTGKKLLFALYRAGKTTIEEDRFIEEGRRKKLGIDQ